MSEERTTPPAGDSGAGGVDWDRYEAEVSDDAAAPVLVDSAEAQRTPGKLTVAGLRAAERAPLLPAWLKSRAEFRDMARWTLGHAWHTLLYQAIRVPKYALRLALRAPRGAARIIGGFTRWVFDLEGEPLRQVTARHEDPETYLKLARLRDARVRWRGIVAVPVLAVLIALSVFLAVAKSGVRVVSVAAIVAGLGIVGRRADKPLLDTAVAVPKVAKLTSDVVVRALSVLGLAGINQALAKNPAAIGFAAPITRDGPGWRADVDLPYGVTAGEVIDRRDKLASGLGRPLGCVWPEGNTEVSPSRLMLWVGDQDMATAKQPVWPLARSGQVDLFKAFPFGTDPRGRPVGLCLNETNTLTGALPGAGKTVAMRNQLLAAALDPRAELWVFELKGTGDLEALAKVSARYGSGPDDDTIEQALVALRDLRAECARRAKVIKGLPKSVCPDNKVTPHLASRKNLGLHHLVAGFDEVQELFTHPEFGKEAGELAEKVIKLGRALGISLLLATQRPDSRSLPTGVSANVGTRFCLRVMGQLENDMILGTSAYKNGVRATMFTKKDRGVGYLVGAAEDPQIVRTYYVDGQVAEKISLRARALREAAGTLSGHAAGQPTAEAPKRRPDALLGDLLTVMPAGEAKAWNDALAARLADLDPASYRGWTGEQLTAALKPLGVTTGQVWATDPATGKGTNRRGITRKAVAAALERRTRPATPPPDEVTGQPGEGG
jgi:S-DNA-T family DNA segregation ATPase FtsK/SpoIIIE